MILVIFNKIIKSTIMIDERIQILKDDLLKDDLALEQILQKHIIDIEAYLFISDKKNLEYEVRHKIANSFGVHLNEVVIVGSAKIGYSLSPKKLYNKMDSLYNVTNMEKDKSDIDVAIISSTLFRELQKSLYDFTNGLKIFWKKNETYRRKRNPKELPIDYQFYKYNYKGWFRPDFKPTGFEVCKSNTLEELKREILELTNRKLAIAIYQDWSFFKNYHLSNLKTLKLKAQTELL